MKLISSNVFLQLAPDKEWTLMFAVFDENKSWYFNESMQKSSRDSSSLSDSEFYSSNIIYSEFNEKWRTDHVATVRREYQH